VIFAFYKYEGTGNDFIMIDDRLNLFPVKKEVISRLCDRRMGIGSDGLILIKNSNSTDFHMDFYNPDGSQSFCGNGSRCVVAFAFRLGIVGKETTFTAIDGTHHGQLLDNNKVKVSMGDVNGIKNLDLDLILNTGSPHYVRFVNDLENERILETGRAIRYSEKFKKDGINVNLVEKLDAHTLKCKTYERGVENETLSCGTGVTAVAISANFKYDLKPPITIFTSGGELKVDFKKINKSFTNITLEGPVKAVYKGEINA
jgi:diaminopimelate epimerase